MFQTPLLLIFSFFTAFFHPLHLSITDIERTAGGSIEIAHKFFIDDFEQAVNNRYGVKLRLGQAGKELPDANAYIQKYIDETFSVSLNGIAKQPAFVGRENDAESVWIYRELGAVAGGSKLNVQCSSLLDLYDDQKNIVHFKHAGGKQSGMLDSGKRGHGFDF